MATMMLVSVMGVSAANSTTNAVTPSGESDGKYIVTVGDKAFDAVKDEEAKVAIAELQKGTIPQSVVDDIKGIKESLAGKTLVTDIFDLKKSDGSTGGGTATLTVPALANCKEVVVLHYSTVRGTWELIDGTRIKVNGTTLTITLDDLSPIAIYAKETKTDANGSSPETVGTSSTWMLWTAIAVVALGAGVVATQKKRHS